MKIYEVNELGREIKKRRKELGYTQSYIASFTGFSMSFISDVENGKSTVELGRVITLANILGMDIEITKRG